MGGQRARVLPRRRHRRAWRQGLVRVKSFTAEPDAIARYGPLEDERGAPRSRSSSSARRKGVLLARIDGRRRPRRGRAAQGHARSICARDALPRARRRTSSTTPIWSASPVELARRHGLGTVRAVHDFGAGDSLEIDARRRRAGARAVHRAPRCRWSISPAAASSSRRPRAARARRSGASVSMAPGTATVLTLFPEMFPGPLGHSLAGKALAEGLWRLETVDIRDFARDKHRSVDDAPFGGGPGMVMRPDVVDAAIAGSRGAGAADLSVAARPAARPGARRGAGGGAGRAASVRPLRGHRPARHRGARDRGGEPRRFRAVGRRAGGDRADRRLRAAAARRRRRRGGARGGEFRSGDCSNIPHYTRPQTWQGRAVPEVLLSGHHDEDPPLARRPRRSGRRASAARICGNDIVARADGRAE